MKSQTWYYTPPFTFGAERIQAVQISHASPHTVWLAPSGRRASRHTRWGHFWPTWDEARDYLLKKAHQKRVTIELDLRDVTSEIYTLTHMEKPQ